MGIFDRLRGIRSSTLDKASISASQLTGGMFGSGKLGTSSVAAKGQAGASATVISQSRYLMTFFEKQEDFADAIKENDKKVLSKLKKHNQDILDQSIILNVEGMRQDFLAYKQYVAQLMQVAKQYGNTLANIKKAYMTYRTDKTTLSKENLTVYFSEVPNVLSGLLGVKIDRSIPLSIDKTAKLSREYHAGGNIEVLAETLENAKNGLITTLSVLLDKVKSNKELKKEEWAKFLEKLSNEIDLFEQLAQKALSMEWGSDFNQKVTQIYTMHLSSSLVDFYQNWQLIQQLVDYQLKVEEKLYMMTPDVDALKREINSHVNVPISQTILSISKRRTG